MINIIWGSLIIIGILYGLLSGNIEVINEEILASAKTGLNMILDILPIMVIWLGLMKIAENSGLLNKFANLLSKPLHILFPSIPKGHKSLSLIASNVAVNMLGLGNAATPIGLKAMESMQELNTDKKTASEAMITFLVINTTGITLIPTTVIALRILHGSTSPTETILASTIASASGMLFGLIIDYLYRKKNRICK